MEGMTDEIFVLAFMRLRVKVLLVLSLGFTRLSWNLWCFLFAEPKSNPNNF